MKRKTLDEFISDARKIHGYKYDYSEAEYINARTKIKIKCNKCGQYFWQKPSSHLGGCGCPNCYGTHKRTLKEFQEESNKIHSEKYKVAEDAVYVNCKTPIKLICPIHGEFWQTPQDHLNGSGCPKCGGTDKLSTEEFITRSKAIHGDKYDYSKINYINNRTQVCIICPIHGEFWQQPAEHMRNHGCPKCNQSKMEKEISELFTENKIDFIPQKHFQWLGLQTYDFYLPKYNIAIECQGGQHFKSIKHYGGDKGLEKIINRDKRKLKLSKEHNVNLLYYANYEYDFPYKVFTDKQELLKEITIHSPI